MPFLTNRKRAFELMPDNSALVLASASMQQRSNDTFFPFRQESNFYYLTGFTEDDAYLVMSKKSGKCETTLFVRPKDPIKELWEGIRTGVKKALKDYGVEATFKTSEFEAELKTLLKEVHTVYEESTHPIEALHRVIKTAKQGKESHLFADTFTDMRTILHTLRRTKQPWEIKRIKTALEITKKAHYIAMAAASPSKFEYELQALIEYVFKSNGAYWDAYTTIVAGGNNANTLHYVSNRDKLKDGALILLDAGSEFEMYASDITRTFPVNGSFSAPQKELYSEVLAIQKEVIEMIKPQVMRSQLGDFAIKRLTQLMIDMKIIEASLDEAIEKELYKPFYPHGIGHWMGLDVHDPLAYKNLDGSEIAFEEGDVLTIEPGIYLNAKDKKIPAAYRGIGIRIEDNILVTSSGYDNLSSGIDKEIKQIESRCQASIYDYI